jgi:putative ubiquitin-RnfH superfamily antitoxin RatB of RatAB toxin-antitoxin module
LIVTVCWATPEVQDVVPVALPPGARVADAVRLSGLVARYGLDIAALRFARFGARVAADTTLEPGDRVDLVRGLIADPKATRARRARARTTAGQAAPSARGNPRS